MKLYIHVQIFNRKIQVKLEFDPYSMIYDGDMPIKLRKKNENFSVLEGMTEYKVEIAYTGILPENTNQYFEFSLGSMIFDRVMPP